MATKKNSAKKEMEEMHDHEMMHHGMKGKGIVYLVVGVIFVYLAYTWSAALIVPLVTLGIGLWFLSAGSMKMGWNMMGYGCGCCGCCDCEWDEKG
ncbi:MAG: hypothetical protein KGH53_02275 [Candidatus Micrarchaeota archaeon]|nr:hypothetical protein [Candidatus Micrarchaeota archaeon]